MESFLQLFNPQNDKDIRKRQWNDFENNGNGLSDCETSSTDEDQEDCLPPEPEQGNIEYKLKLINPSSQRFEHLVTQMKWRLREGHGEAIYQIGVEDNGKLAGLTKEEMKASLKTLKDMASRLGANIRILRERAITSSTNKTLTSQNRNNNINKEEKKVAEVLVKKLRKDDREDQDSIVDLRLAVIGAQDAGKSTLLGVLTQGELDNGRGRARLNMLRHLHEIKTGRTSSISHEIIGFDSTGHILNYAEMATAEEICEHASKVVTFIDLAGHRKYLRTTVLGLTGYSPHHVMLVVAPPLNEASQEHMVLCLALKLPFFIVVNKIDLGPPSTTVPGEDFGVPVLTVHNVDPCIEENGENHRTSRYELMTRRDDRARLVVRRGQEFYLHLSLSRDYISSIDGISIVFTLDGIERPQYGHGTLVATALLNPGEISEAAWQTTIDARGQNFLRIKIVPSANAIIGKWKMEIDTKNKETEGAVSYTMDHPFYLICNPWCEDDVVYLENEDERQEYVLAEDGLIWRGNRNRLRPTVWKYAQFERDILDSALHLMNQVGKVRVNGRNDPVVITRCLSAAVNSPDDNGAVMGNWSDDYEGGTPPTRWMGSQKILQEYYKTKKPVKYGQCWVFSGVLATVCRTLGIPCRVVTNYSSAHDTQSSLTVDYFVNAEGKIMEELNSDSIWNFHVWNEVWMKRLDLSPDCSGWQAIDATPQELSEGAYRCGPASVTAVKKGEVLRPYDNAFLFAEVNADKVFWRYNGPTQPLKLIRKDMYGIGQLISTKAVGKWTREDITHTYKYPESSDEERAAMLKALRQSESLFSRYYLNEEFNDVMFTFELRDDIIIGQPFSVVLLIKNRNSIMEYRVSVILRVETVLYTGRVGEPVKRLHIDRLVRPGVLEEIRMDVSWEEYGPRLLDQCAFNIACLATVKDTNFEYFAQDDFRVRKPDIKITLHNDAIVGQILNASAKFRNPLPIPLKKGRFLIEGPGLDEQLKLKLSESVEVDADAECTFSMIPKLEGRARIAAKFYSKELDDVDGHSNNFIVKSAKIASNSE